MISSFFKFFKRTYLCNFRLYFTPKSIIIFIFKYISILLTFSLFFYLFFKYSGEWNHFFVNNFHLDADKFFSILNSNQIKRYHKNHYEKIKINIRNKITNTLKYSDNINGNNEAKINELIKNYDYYGSDNPNFYPIIVIYVYNRREYLSKILDSLSKVKGIEHCTLIISHDAISKKMFDEVNEITFTNKVIELIDPYIVSHPPGYYRLYHHWYWLHETVFDVIDKDKIFNWVIFLEEDHFVSPDFLQTARKMINIYKKDKIIQSRCFGFSLFNWYSKENKIKDFLILKNYLKRNKIKLSEYENYSTDKKEKIKTDLNIYQNERESKTITEKIEGPVKYQPIATLQPKTLSKEMEKKVSQDFEISCSALNIAVGRNRTIWEILKKHKNEYFSNSMKWCGWDLTLTVMFYGKYFPNSLFVPRLSRANHIGKTGMHFNHKIKDPFEDIILSSVNKDNINWNQISVDRSWDYDCKDYDNLRRVRRGKKPPPNLNEICPH